MPVSEWRSAVHVVVREPSGSELGFGELVRAVGGLPVSERGCLSLKPQSEWRYIGQDADPSHDVTRGHVRRPKAIDGEEIVATRSPYHINKSVIDGDLETPLLWHLRVASASIEAFCFSRG